MNKPQNLPSSTISEALITRIASLALGCVDRPYPYYVSHVLRSDEDLVLPARPTPAFYGCFDWHSAVHAHWTLARILRLWPQSSLASECGDVLDRHIDPTKIQAELAYLTPRENFERPYGLAWVLALASELRLVASATGAGWADALEPLERLAADRLLRWSESLPAPIRSGQHGQSAFGMSLTLDWARALGDEHAAKRIEDSALRLHVNDRDASLHLEPSAYDFLSPSLGVADLMRRVLSPTDFAAWLDRWLPAVPTHTEEAEPWLPVPRSPNPEDGKLSHLDGLASSRTWMLEGIANGLPETDPRREILLNSATAHAQGGRAGLESEHYAGTHWLGTFALYAATQML
jgi:hypothetical protein